MIGCPFCGAHDSTPDRSRSSSSLVDVRVCTGCGGRYKVKREGPITARVDILPFSDGHHEVRVTVDSKVITVVDVPDMAAARRVLDDVVKMAQDAGGQLQ